MSTEEIVNRIGAIRDMRRDYEIAHSMEDKLMVDFITYVATLDIPLAEKAKLVLTTSQIDFERYTA